MNLTLLTRMPAQARIDFLVQPGGPLTGCLQVPGDKSISHRALMLAAIAAGDSRITGILDGEDIRATRQALVAMGVRIEQPGVNEMLVHGVGLTGLRDPGEPLDLGNSGTSVRLLAGLLAGQEFDSELRGDESLMSRPMQRIVDPLKLMGADINCTAAGTLPIKIQGGHKLRGISYSMPVASAQLKSAVLLAGLYAVDQTCVQEPAVTRDHTERMLEHFSCPVLRTGGRICLDRRPLTARQIDVPGDISSAAFFLVAASILAGSELLLYGVGINPTRHAVVEILAAMGADICLEQERFCSGEPVADIRVRSRPLQGIRIPAHLVPVAIDEFPAIMIAAACASGETVLTGAEELRVKESDRIQALADGLAELGINVTTTADGMSVTGGRLGGGTVCSSADHRIAMAFTMAGLAASGPVIVQDCINVDTSFPGFVDCLQTLGMPVTQDDSRRV